jgi:hypothetical protein
MLQTKPLHTLQLRADALRELSAVKEALATEKRKREEGEAGLRQQLEKQFQEQARPTASLFLFFSSCFIFF